MNGIIRDFALRILRRLTITNQPEEPPPSHATEVDMDAKVSPNAENGASDSVGTPDASAAQDQADHEAEYPGTPYLPDRLQPPVDKSVVLQHVELLFALCVKVPEFLDE
jgi:symplekin